MSGFPHFLAPLLLCLPAWLLLGQIAGTVCRAQAEPAGARARAPVVMFPVESELEEVIRQGSSALAAVAVFQSTPDIPLLPQQDPVAAMFTGMRPVLLPIRFGAGIVVGESSGGDSLFLLTCAHLLEPVLTSKTAPDPAQVFVSFGPRQTVRATVRALDGRSDLAVLQVPKTKASPRPLKLGDASGLSPGRLVISLGDPRGIAEESRCSAGGGMVSRWQTATRPVRSERLSDPLATLGLWLRIDAAVGRNLSGGAILNLQGELVGISTALPLVPGPDFQTLYAIPGTSAIHRVIRDLMAGYEVDYGFLGIQPKSPGDPPALLAETSPDGSETADLPVGVSVAAVSTNSPAARAGLLPNDRIVRINSQEVDRGIDLQREVALLGAGSSVLLTVFRPGSREPLELKVSLGKWPVGAGMPVVSTVPRSPSWRGLQLDYPTARLEWDQDGFIPEIPHGVLIRAVDPGSPAASAGLKVGGFIAKVGEQPVETPDEFRNALQYWSGQVPVTLADGHEVMIPEAR